MASKPPAGDPVQDAPQVTEPKHAAAGLPAIGHTLRIAQQQMGVRRTALTLLRVNQKDGFDCPGCAWPEPEHRHTAEFCENGAKAVAEEATLRRVTPDFFAAHPVSDLAGRSGYWLGQQGRLTHPMYLPEGGDHYEPVDWQRAFDIVAGELKDLASPDEAVFYTSGRTSNEAAFLYQLFARELGTNNLPDCSNMCHESSGSALSETIGVGKGSVLLDDLYQADLIIVAGQNPGTNHPRMLSALEKAKSNGAKIITVNPLPEAGMERFKNPQTPQGMLKGAALTDLFLQIRLGGDQALFRLLNKLILATPSTSTPCRPSARSSTSSSCAATSAAPAQASARSAATRTSRATARWASSNAPRPRSSTPWRRSSASPRPANTATTSSGPSAPCATARPRSSSPWAATSSPPPPTPTSPRRPCGAPG